MCPSLTSLVPRFCSSPFTCTSMTPSLTETRILFHSPAGFSLDGCCLSTTGNRGRSVTPSGSTYSFKFEPPSRMKSPALPACSWHSIAFETDSAAPRSARTRRCCSHHRPIGTKFQLEVAVLLPCDMYPNGSPITRITPFSTRYTCSAGTALSFTTNSQFDKSLPLKIAPSSFCVHPVVESSRRTKTVEKLLVSSCFVLLLNDPYLSFVIA